MIIRFVQGSGFESLAIMAQEKVAMRRAKERDRYAAKRAFILEQKREYYRHNKSRLLAKAVEYYEKNKDDVGFVARKSERVAKNKERYAANRRAKYATEKEKHSAKQRIYRAKNKNKIAAGKRAYREANKDRVVIKINEWLAKNRDRVRCYRKTRRARKLGAGGHYTPADISALWKRQAGRCVGCDASLLLSCTVDHVAPLSRGGSNWPSNLQLLCKPCNSSKGRKTMEEWRAA